MNNYKIIKLINANYVKEDNPLIKKSSIGKINKKSNATNKRYLKILKDNNLIGYIGSDKIGGYKVVTNG